MQAFFTLMYFNVLHCADVVGIGNQTGVYDKQVSVWAISWDA
jgi:hypothetical protein